MTTPFLLNGVRRAMGGPGDRSATRINWNPPQETQQGHSAGNKGGSYAQGLARLRPAYGAQPSP
jgi:hypothetical protein